MANGIIGGGLLLAFGIAPGWMDESESADWYNDQCRKIKTRRARQSPTLQRTRR